VKFRLAICICTLPFIERNASWHRWAKDLSPLFMLATVLHWGLTVVYLAPYCSARWTVGILGGVSVRDPIVFHAERFIDIVREFEAREQATQLSL
jgi:hypothetical protein